MTVSKTETRKKVSYQEVIRFWFEDIEPAKWWVKDLAFDQEIRDRFSELHQQAGTGELVSWRAHPLGRLAEVIVLDQFSRNMYRDSAQSFAYDALALVLAQEAVAGGYDQLVSPEQQSFFYLPYMHSESLLIHEQAVVLYEALGNTGSLEFELRHKSIIERFGRYPHRNQILARSSSETELAFLTQPDSSF